MSTEKQFGDSIASNEHLQTLAALMQQQGMDIAFGEAETHGGIPYAAMIVQGAYTKSMLDVMEAAVAKVAQMRLDDQAEAEKG